MNEIPLQHTIKTIDGNTSGSKGFTGPLGKNRKYCEKRLVVKYKAIEADLYKMYQVVYLVTVLYTLLR